MKYLLFFVCSLLLLSACSNEEDILYSDLKNTELTRGENNSLVYPMSSFITKINLDLKDEGIVNAYLNGMQNEFGKWYLPLFVKLKAEPIAEITRGSTGTKSKAPAAYFASQNILVFLTGSTISENGVHEELIHAGQQRIYPGGIVQYGQKEGTPNIEFEAKLTQDIINCINDLPFNLGEGLNNSTQYVQWMLEISDNGFPSMTKVLETKISSIGYYGMVEAFSKRYEDYNYPVSMTLKPLYINYISNSIK
ncbi:MAG: hypothetical protein K2K25_04625 [Muribaculaceae bacterium]|nr:hypothetical protein [Muribaculaceae bacterium]